MKCFLFIAVYLTICTRAHTQVDLPEMISVPGGSFQMGDSEGLYDEKPMHKVFIDSFYIGKYEITVAQFAAFIQETAYLTETKAQGQDWKHNTEGVLRPSTEFNHPVMQVSWLDAAAYCKWLSRKTGKKYRLPTEAEWEYAAKGGNKIKDYDFSGSIDIDEVAWYSDNAGKTTHAVGTKRPNDLGAFDMTGNVWEWCNDWYDADYYANSPSRNPSGPTSGSDRVIRGGSWDTDNFCRIVFRYNTQPTYQYNYLGFRIARSD